ncbi:MAG: winged helix-turn-helix transcriptional regulator [Muribaculaceae bacterium]|nr:winged helix-turn-helix transcriptional regulator [Muribaculaceae bacterium]
MGSEPKNEPYDEPNDEPKEDPSCGPSEKMGKNELVLKELKLDSSITRKQLAQKLGLSDSTIKRVLAKLKSTGKLKRIGDTFSGYWVVIED